MAKAFTENHLEEGYILRRTVFATYNEGKTFKSICVEDFEEKWEEFDKKY